MRQQVTHIKRQFIKSATDLNKFRTYIYKIKQSVPAGYAQTGPQKRTNNEKKAVEKESY